MGLFNRNRQEPPDRPSSADLLAPIQEKKAQAMQMSAQLMSMDVQAMQQAAAAARQASAGGPAAGTAAVAGSMTWVRQVLSILAPPQPGFVKRCSCAVCGAPKKLPTVTAYVYCDYCASLIDYDLRRACEGDVVERAGIR